MRGCWNLAWVTHPQRGTPQGGVISPPLGNLYPHEVLDEWFEHEVEPRGRAIAVRYADDAALAFEQEGDARRVLAKRFAKYGLRPHPEKTRRVDFRSPCRTGQRERGFVLLGFYPLLGALQEGALGGTTQGGPGPPYPCRAGDRSELVPPSSPLAGGGPTAGAMSQAQGPLRLLRHHRQRACAEAFSLRGSPSMAQGASSPIKAHTDALGAFQPSASVLPAPPSARCSQCICRRSESVVRGAGCLNWARPDLWEPRAVARPRRPSP